ncbi:Signal peptidase complex catalytic subunit SEC11C [Ananas comosus]|uniref:Signal peptidase complex catalytic subunit SEC11 n=1 Tax=Ananas comosus TaxID=4615 RepID=A0A199VTR0_ANACO|nr:Signal peptidase complex catalytic subunit SEC11C [Ananas comosus]
MIWKGLMCFAGSESPVVVVLTGSMEPGFKRGDILFLHMNKDPIRAGEIVVYNVDGRDIPIVHRVIKVHERKDTRDVYILTKVKKIQNAPIPLLFLCLQQTNRHLIESSGDNNPVDDISLYPQGQFWLERHHIIGRAVGYLPHVGWVTIIMTEKPIIKYLLIGALGLLVLSSKE